MRNPSHYPSDIKIILFLVGDLGIPINLHLPLLLAGGASKGTKVFYCMVIEQCQQVWKNQYNWALHNEQTADWMKIMCFVARKSGPRKLLDMWLYMCGGQKEDTKPSIFLRRDSRITI